MSSAHFTKLDALPTSFLTISDSVTNANSTWSSQKINALSSSVASAMILASSTSNGLMSSVQFGIVNNLDTIKSNIAGSTIKYLTGSNSQMAWFTLDNATSSQSGLMSATDYSKLQKIASPVPAADHGKVLYFQTNADNTSNTIWKNISEIMATSSIVIDGGFINASGNLE
jgi:hypothetical protein